MRQFIEDYFTISVRFLVIAVNDEGTVFASLIGKSVQTLQ
jgi:hypothetical protein